MHPFRSTFLVLTLALALSASFGVKAAPIGPGFDLFATSASPLTIHPPQPCVTSCTLTFQGFAISSGTTGPGNTDTIIQRTGSLTDGATGEIASQLVELSLKSQSPVNIGGSFFDVFVDVNAIPPGPATMPTGPPVYDTLSPSTGTTTIDTNGPTGGTFHSFFDVFVDVILTAPGGDPSNPAQVVSHFAESGFTESISGTWYPPGPCIPNTGPGTGACQNGGFTPLSTTVTAGPLAWSPAVVPEPSTAVLLTAGVLGLAVRQRHVPGASIV
jgi:hypothetical protein